MVVLENMVTAEELASEVEMAEVLDDTKVEAENHGRVVVLAALKPEATAAEGAEAAQYALKVFVHFDAADAAAKCAQELHGKAFDGRTVRATFVSEEVFTRLTSLPCYKTA